MRKFAEESNFHGLSQLVRLDGKAQKFWIVVLLIALGGLLLQIGHLVGNLLEDEVGTTVTEARRDRMTIPDVIVCLPASLSKQKLIKFSNLHDDAKLEAFDLALQWLASPIAFSASFSPLRPEPSELMSFYAPHYSNLYHGGTKVKEWMEMLEAVKNTYEPMKRNLSATLPDIVSLLSTSCSQTVEYCLDEQGKYNCCKDSETFNLFVSTCFKIKGREQSYDGSHGAMTIAFGINKTDYVKPPTFIEGIAVTVIDRDSRETEIHPMKENAVTELVLEKTRMHSINRKRTPCDERKNSLPTMDCINACLLRLIKGEGTDDCGYLGLSEYDESRYCDNALDEFKKNKGQMEYFKMSPENLFRFARNKLKICRKDCLYKCKVSSHRSKVSNVRILKDKDSDSSNKSRAIVRVYYGSVREQRIIQYRKTSANDFIGMLGGLISLWCKNCNQHRMFTCLGKNSMTNGKYTGGSFVALCHLASHGLVYRLQKRETMAKQ